jgi:hypothetical protein
MGTRHLRVASAGSIAAALLLSLAFCSVPASAATCPNEAIRTEQGTTALPNCMALEMVSPVNKYNQYASLASSSPNGQRIRYISLAALADTPKQAYIFDRYIATRTDSGWVTESTATSPQITTGSNNQAYPCSYSTDLSRWVLWGSTGTQETLGITTPFADGLGAPFTAIGPTMVPLTGSDKFAITSSRCEGASADASRFLFGFDQFGLIENRIGFSYLPGDPVPIRGTTEPFGNVYEAYLEDGVPSVRLLQRDKDGVNYGGSCGARVGGSDFANRGSVSPDASRIYFSARPGQAEGVACDVVANKLRIFERSETPAGPVITELIGSECTRVSPPCSGADGDDDFQGASQEGDKVYFTTARQLADTDLDETADLYLHESTAPPGERLTQVSAGEASSPTPGQGAEVLGLTDFSGDGSHAYFVAKGVLSETANQAGALPQAGQPNLYLYQRDGAYPGGRTAFIGTLDPADQNTLWISAPGQNSALAVPSLGEDLFDHSVGGDGHILLFGSKAPLLPTDTDGGFRDEYRYDAESAELQRISAAAPGGADSGPFEASESSFSGTEVGPQALFLNRSISEDGETIVFRTEEGLDPADTNGAESAYIWHQGTLTALPSATSPNVSASGNQVTFETPAKLLPQDGDGATDVYAARVNGGFPAPVVVAPCEGEACQGTPSPQPGALTSPSESPSGNGNVKPKPGPACPKGKRQVTRKGKTRCVKKKGRHKKRRATKQQGGRR